MGLISSHKQNVLKLEPNITPMTQMLTGIPNVATCRVLCILLMGIIDTFLLAAGPRSYYSDRIW